ncbi:hypothetical protein QQ045_021379 [Rhodiola kirilowii]
MADYFNVVDNNEHTSALDDKSCTFVSVNRRKCWIPKCLDELKPHVGMTFPNLDKVVLFYKEYARIAGFVMRLATSNRSDGIITIKYLSRRDTRCGCQARLQVNIAEGGRYRVYLFEESHNHHLESDIGKQFLTSHREMSLIDKQFMVVDNLSDKIKTCPGYLFEYFLDEEEILTRLFWADVISRRENTIFGDVVSFDATYRMNTYNLVLVIFTDVDNQLRSVTLAASLISKEDIDSYTWLLTCFKKLSEREPSVIVTDQDASMKAVVATMKVDSYACGIL